MSDYVENYTTDFNDVPLSRLVVLRQEHADARVGDLLRLIDLDPTAGFMLVKITELELRPSGRTVASVELIEYTQWTPWENKR